MYQLRQGLCAAQAVVIFAHIVVVLVLVLIFVFVVIIVVAVEHLLLQLLQDVQEESHAARWQLCHCKHRKHTAALRQEEGEPVAHTVISDNNSNHRSNSSTNTSNNEHDDVARVRLEPAPAPASAPIGFVFVHSRRNQTRTTAKQHRTHFPLIKIANIAQ